jgi:hypothetical protein
MREDTQPRAGDGSICSAALKEAPQTFGFRTSASGLWLQSSYGDAQLKAGFRAGPVYSGVSSSMAVVALNNVHHRLLIPLTPNSIKTIIASEIFPSGRNGRY